MLLAVDVGNTNIVFGLYEGSEERASWRLSTTRTRTADEYALALLPLMNMAGFKAEDIQYAIVSSVVPQVARPLRRLLGEIVDCKTVFVGDDIEVPIEVRLANPAEAGADRLVNAFAAHKAYDGHLIVIDFGTATTFDVVDASGAFCGGVIAPGINLSLDALHQAAAKLPRISIELPKRVIGDSTVAAMQSGVYWGYVAMIEGMVERIRAEYGRPMRTIATGGLAPLFAGATGVIEHVDADLTMAGLIELHRVALLEE